MGPTKLKYIVSPGGSNWPGMPALSSSLVALVPPQFLAHPLSWTSEEWVVIIGILWFIFNAAFVFYSAFIFKPPAPAVSVARESKHFAVSDSENFDIHTFLKHLRKGTFEVGQVRRGILGPQRSLLLTSACELMLVTPSRGSGSAQKEMEQMQQQEEQEQQEQEGEGGGDTQDGAASPPVGGKHAPPCSWQLNHLTDAQVMEDDEEPMMHISFGEQESLVLHCKAEDDLCFLAKGFHILAIRLADPNFAEEFLTNIGEEMDKPMPPVNSMKQVIDLSISLFQIPAMPIYAAINALSAETTTDRSSPSSDSLDKAADKTPEQ